MTRSPTPLARDLADDRHDEAGDADHRHVGGVGTGKLARARSIEHRHTARLTAPRPFARGPPSSADAGPTLLIAEFERDDGVMGRVR